MECIGKGKARKPYDGHILNAILKQSAKLTRDAGITVKQAVADLGFCGVDTDNPDRQIIRRGKIRSMSQQKGWLRRRQAIEPAIGHLKPDNSMDRCWPQGALGDLLHTIGCAAGYNLRWLLRAIARLGIGAVFCVCYNQSCRLNESQERHTVLMAAHGFREGVFGSVAQRLSERRYGNVPYADIEREMNFAGLTI